MLRSRCEGAELKHDIVSEEEDMKKKSGTEELIQIGFISKPQGFKGEIIFAIEKGDADNYASSKFFFIELHGGLVPFFAEEIKLNGDSMIVKLEDVNTEAAAKKLSGKKIFVEGSETTALASEINWDSLIGYHVFDKSYGRLGILEGIEEYPQQIIARCTVKGKEVLFPLNEDLISEIDDEKKELRLNLPEGLLDVYLD